MVCAGVRPTLRRFGGAVFFALSSGGAQMLQRVEKELQRAAAAYGPCFELELVPSVLHR